MRFRFLYAISATLFLFGCAAPSPITKLPQATSVDDYCNGAGDFAANVAARYRDQGDDFEYTKQVVLADAASLSDPSQTQERMKMLDVLAYVYRNPSRTPKEVYSAVYQTCMEERAAGTWFHN
jgi:hypothetical protein